MILDAQSFKTVLTPEAAMGIVQKALAQKGWKKFEIEDVKLVYVPYWLFSFDVIAQGGASPTGKTALNAFTGELNDFIPVLFDRPLKKTRETAEGVEAEIEPTSITAGEVKEAAAVKVAAHVGLGKDSVSISGATKFYVPFYRIWVDVANDTFKIDVDAMLGYPSGLEALPERTKSWDEATKETVEKLKTPSGWAELGSKTVSEVGKAASGAPISGGGLSKQWLQIGLVLAILVLAYFTIVAPQTSGSVDCKLAETYLGKAAWFGLGSRPIIPSYDANGSMFVQGACFFTNTGSGPMTLVEKLSITSGDRILGNSVAMVVNLPPSKVPSQQYFNITWPAQPGPFAFSHEGVM